MNSFTEWIKRQEPEGPKATSHDITTQRNRSRLRRMEAMLEELMRLKEIVARRTDHANS